jgi:hypothetical protein
LQSQATGEANGSSQAREARGKRQEARKANESSQAREARERGSKCYKNKNKTNATVKIRTRVLIFNMKLRLR